MENKATPQIKWVEVYLGKYIDTNKLLTLLCEKAESRGLPYKENDFKIEARLPSQL